MFCISFFFNTVHTTMDFFDRNNDLFKEVFHKTKILRKPITGIVSGYHELPYILIAPNADNTEHTIEITGKINVSPKFVITPGMLGEAFDSIFDPETFDEGLQGRMFSFAHGNSKNMKVENEYFKLQTIEEHPDNYVQTILDQLMARENIKTGLIASPHFRYYPISIDKFITEILHREFNV